MIVITAFPHPVGAEVFADRLDAIARMAGGDGPVVFAGDPLAHAAPECRRLLSDWRVPRGRRILVTGRPVRAGRRLYAASAERMAVDGPDGRPFLAIAADPYGPSDAPLAAYAGDGPHVFEHPGEPWGLTRVNVSWEAWGGPVPAAGLARYLDPAAAFLDAGLERAGRNGDA